MGYYAPEHVPADSPHLRQFRRGDWRRNSETTALLSNGEADIAAVATNVASTSHKTEGSIQVLAVNTLGCSTSWRRGDSIQSMADLRARPSATGRGQPGASSTIC